MRSDAMRVDFVCERRCEYAPRVGLASVRLDRKAGLIGAVHTETRTHMYCVRDTHSRAAHSVHRNRTEQWSRRAGSRSHSLTQSLARPQPCHS